MPKGHRRDIYKGRFDPGFCLDKDVDLEHLRDLMTREKITNEEYNYYGLYIRNIINIVLNSHWFRGYPEDVKEDMMTESLIDTIKVRLKFNGEKYPNPSAPFNYIWRVAFHSCQHVLDNYYKTRQNLFTPASQVGAGTCLMDSSEEFSDDIIEKAVNDWEEIELNLRDSTRGQSQTTKSDQPEGQSQESTETCRSHQDE